jgi:hypothetical protein
MKTILTFLALSLVLAPRVTALAPGSRSDEQAAVIKVVQEFFDALHAKDGERLRATCQPGAQFSSGRPAPEGYAVRSRTVEADATRLAEAKEPWLERMWTPTVLIENRIAVLWTRYDFHRDGKFSHNGTDCFTLLKTDQGWKIACCAYSVEPGAQTENPAGPPQ